MCGIVGAIAARPVKGILLEGLRRLEYRGYDSAGLAIRSTDGTLNCTKAVGKVAELENCLNAEIDGTLGIAHTRWATHGKPTTANAHPHCSGPIALVHNGIIENYQQLREQLTQQGYEFLSETDTEVVAHLMHKHWQQSGDMLQALRDTTAELDGAYALCVINQNNPNTLYIAREGSPLVVGLGIGENFVASDQLALRPVTDRFIFLDEGDIGTVSAKGLELFNKDGQPVTRSTHQITEDAGDAHRGEYRHFMLKEIYEQPAALQRTLSGRLGQKDVLVESLGLGAEDLLKTAESIHIVACGTSYHAGLVAKYWIEELIGISVAIEVASEYRYRRTVVPNNCLFITVSQSGETADTLAALRKAKGLKYLAHVAVCNVTSSSLVRESDLLVATNAGPEIGVASTKAFTTQLVAFLLLTFAIAKAKGQPVIHPVKGYQVNPRTLFDQLIPLCEEVLQLDSSIDALSKQFADKHHALFLGRGPHYAVALEGALKLKEISYIHAEAYPSGELKHGPLALVDDDMPVIAVAPTNDLLEKLKSNLEEVKSRGGKLYVLADEIAGFKEENGTTILSMPHVPLLLEPIVYSIPLQLLAYHVALVKGTDVDQPRNLAKSVTVE